MQQPAPSPGESPAQAASSSRLRRLLQRAEAYVSSNQIPSAMVSLESALQLQPDNVPALLMLADLHLTAERHNDARAAALKAVHGHMESPKVALHLLRTLNQLSESGLMIEIARQLPPPLWDSAKSLAEMSQEMSLIGAHELSREFARAGVARDPNHPPSLVMHATEDVFYGELDSAAALAERCVSILPGDPGSHWLLSRLRLPGWEARVARIERELASGVPPEIEAWLRYAVHNELHDAKEYERAWAALDHACRAKRATLDYQQSQSDALFDALCDWSADELATADGCDDERLTPIFVIGLHRSGTTLAERILSGHSQVTAGGETYDIRAALRRATNLHYPSELDPRVIERRHTLDYRAIGEGFLQGIAWRAGASRLVTDKLPSNYMNLGFIARALPRARFIHLRRDPMDVGLSSLRTLFSHACPYSYDQAEFVAHYRNYRRLMAHWHALLPGRILDLDYADLVNAPAESAAAMARFCGLGEEPDMIRIETRNEAVSTASSVMMRDGIRRDRGRLWERYEQSLQPMIRGLAQLES